MMPPLKPLILAIAAGLAMTAVDAGAFEINPRGRLHLDYVFHDDDERELGDKFRVRRARMGLSGKIDDDWSYKIEYDFAENSADAKDIYLRYGGWSVGNVTIGHFKAPFGLEEMTSSNDITFIERSLPSTTFAQSRRIGIGLEGGGERLLYQVMGFGQASGSGVRAADASDEGLGIGGRLVFNPVRGDKNVLHLGIAASTEEPEDSEAETVRFRTRPESRPTGVRLVDTGVLPDVDRISQVGLEAAWQTGPFSIQGEWMRADVSRKRGAVDVDFSGWYAGASYVLTGESRGYGGGRFRGVSPANPRGAWELAARVSNVNLDDNTVLGGEETNYTVGINWYANKHIRFMGNVIFVDSQRRGIDDDPVIFLLRAQVTF